MPTPPNEIRVNTDGNDAPREPSTPELTDTSSPATSSLDLESECTPSPIDSLFGDEPYVPDLRSPKENEEPQVRGRITQGIKAAPANPHPHPQRNDLPPATARRTGGANISVVQSTAPFDHPEAPPNPPNHE
ncbi:hypothetical protein RSOL_496290, partial [Rhizoctonia solani AG-3 Rhs1AP]